MGATYTHHKLDHEFEEGAETTACYAVCALPRSGSSLLCELLFGTGLAGAPAEYFDQALMQEFGLRWNAGTFDAYLETLLARKTGPNGVFGFKAHFFQLAAVFPDGLAASGPELAFPGLRYVYITRRDRLRQAISWARALQSRQWASDHEVEPGPVAFERDQIDNLLAGIFERERRWEAFFAEVGADPLRIAYEQLVAKPEDTVAEVLRHIRVDVPDDLEVPAPTLRRQADELTEEWVIRYLEGERPAGEAVTGESLTRAGSG